MERARERGKSERSLPLGQSHHPNGRALPTEFPPMGPKRGSIHETPLSGAGPPGDLAEILLVHPQHQAPGLSHGEEGSPPTQAGAAPGAVLGRPRRWRPSPTPTGSPGAGQATRPQAGARQSKREGQARSSPGPSPVQAAGQPGGEGVSGIPPQPRSERGPSQAALEGTPWASRHRESLASRQALPCRSGSEPRGLVQQTTARMLNPVSVLPMNQNDV